MSEMAKKAREAMKAKAQRLGASRPLEKVDSADWSPPELLNADIKTGARPISRRAFKKGGKVTGEACEARADRKPRKSGGKAITANSLVNRNVKEANEDRDGIKHVGGFARGGLTKDAKSKIREALGPKTPGNPMRQTSKSARAMIDIAKMSPKNFREAPAEADDRMALKTQKAMGPFDSGYKKGGRTKKAAGGESMPLPPPRPKNLDARPVDRKLIEPGDAASRDLNRMMDIMRREESAASPARKSGGRTKKEDGGPAVGAGKMMKRAQDVAGVPAGGIYGAGFSRAGAGRLSPARGLGMSQMKKGGTAEGHGDEAMDRALIKKMVKPSARTGKKIGGILGGPMGGLIPMALNAMSGDEKDSKKRGGRTGRKDGGKVFSGAGYPHKVPGVTGGRVARATGGKTKAKGKTNVNIVIAAGKPAGGPEMAPPPGPMRPPAAMPVPVPPPGMGAGMPPGMPMPMPPGGAPAGLGAGAPGLPAGPLARKSGGRISKVASSYKDMTAGAGSGEGRLQKADIAKRGGRKAGGKVYRSYKDMDAGAGSGLGRLEKTEIESRKH